MDGNDTQQRFNLVDILSPIVIYSVAFVDILSELSRLLKQVPDWNDEKLRPDLHDWQCVHLMINVSLLLCCTFWRSSIEAIESKYLLAFPFGVEW